MPLRKRPRNLVHLSAALQQSSRKRVCVAARALQSPDDFPTQSFGGGDGFSVAALICGDRHRLNQSAYAVEKDHRVSIVVRVNAGNDFQESLPVCNSENGPASLYGAYAIVFPANVRLQRTSVGRSR